MDRVPVHAQLFSASAVPNQVHVFQICSGTESIAENLRAALLSYILIHIELLNLCRCVEISNQRCTAVVHFLLVPVH